jgi:hypothetical protein
VSLADVKLELNITDAANDAWLAKAITRSSKWLAARCNCSFQVQGYQDQFWAQREPYPWQLPSGFSPLQLSNWPLAAPPSTAGTAPPLAPVLSATAGGALAGASYYVKATYVTPAGETAASMEASLALTANSLLNVAPPIADTAKIATGWNVYIGTKSFGETKQNSSPIAMGTAFILPAMGLITTGGALPNYTLAVENWGTSPRPLAEGIDFLGDYDQGAQSDSKGWLTRLEPMTACPRPWSSGPILVQYAAGYASIPEDLVEGAMELVKILWFARGRDPMLRAENIEGVYSTQYWFGAGPGSSGGLPPKVLDIIDQYRIPVMA